MTQSSTAFGQFFYAVICSGSTYMIWADRIEIKEGALMVYGAPQNNTPSPERLTYIFRAGDWLEVYAASVLDGSAVAVDSLNKNKIKVAKPQGV